MRTIHVLRVEGINEASLSNIFNEELKVIHNTDPHPKSPEKYKDFNYFNRNCTPILQNGLIKYGFKNSILQFIIMIDIIYIMDLD